MNQDIGDSSDTSPLSVCYPPTRPMEVEQPSDVLEWNDFVDSLCSGFLPKGGQRNSPFDQTLRFEVGDPHATDGGLPWAYETSAHTGGPNWHILFKYLLKNCQHVNPAATRQQYARCIAGSLTATTPIDYIAADRAQLFKDDSPLLCLILTHGFALRHLCTTYSSIPDFIAKVRLSIIDEGQQGGQAGFTALAASLPRSCLQIFTGDKEQTRAGTGGDPLKEALLSRLAQKAIGFLGGPNPRLPAEMLSTFAAALRTDTTLKPLLPTDPAPTAFDLIDVLATKPFPVSLAPSSVREAEGLTDTAGVLLHLILPHSLRCPADTYFTQVATHYPHLHRPDGDSIAYGHYENPTPAQAATRQCVDMQGNKYHCSGYRLVHWNPSLRGPTHMLPGSRATALQIAATISYHVARNVRIDSESSKLLILSPHSDTISDLEDVLGASASDLPPRSHQGSLLRLRA